MKNIMNKSLAAVHTHTHTGESNGLKNFEKEHKIKNYYGITLIALVITIIILLILAGVVIGMFKTGHNILNNSKKAAREYSEKEAYEKLSTTMYELQMDKETNKDYNQNDFINNKIIQEGYQIGGDIVKVGRILI